MTAPPSRTSRVMGVVAVVCGFLVAGLVPAAGDAMIRGLAPTAFPAAGHPAPVWLGIALLYTVLGGVAGGAVAGRLHSRPMTLGVLAAAIVAAGLLAWMARPSTAPAWWHGRA